ncbi:MAG TPA: protein kinase, partial [Polyangiaceae bacterium]
LPRVFDIFLQICDALRFAHAQGVVHRDLKPANVLLRGGTHVVVVDFGLAKILTGDAAATVLTAHNMVCGTPEYMAPEQARGDEIDARCDVYAAGVMLYQMLTGDPPFQGPTPLAVLTAHLTSPPVPPRERAPDRGISPALDVVVLHALAKSAADRYPSAAALAAAVLHARATPEDRESVKPDSFRLRVEADADAHSPTQPSLGVARASLRADALSGVDRASLRADAPSERTKPPAGNSTPPPGEAPPRRASDRPPSHRPIPPLRTTPGEGKASSRAWTLIWVVATLASISVGIWLSLRTS